MCDILAPDSHLISVTAGDECLQPVRVLVPVRVTRKACYRPSSTFGIFVLPCGWASEDIHSNSMWGEASFCQLQLRSPHTCYGGLNSFFQSYGFFFFFFKNFECQTGMEYRISFAVIRSRSFKDEWFRDGKELVLSPESVLSARITESECSIWWHSLPRGIIHSRT